MVYIQIDLITDGTDYADSHRNDTWQSFAAASAAAFAKEVLTYTRVLKVNRTHASRNTLDHIQPDVSEIKARPDVHELRREYLVHEKSMPRLLQASFASLHAGRQNQIIEELFKWFTEHPLVNNWCSTQGSCLLWVTTDSNHGKSVLAQYLVNEIIPVSKDNREKGIEDSVKTVCYFFSKDELTKQNSSTSALCSILQQLLRQNPNLAQKEVIDQTASEDSEHVGSFQDLWNIFLAASLDPAAGEVMCILEALDDRLFQDYSDLIRAICTLYKNAEPRGKLKFLVLSKPYDYIQDMLQNQRGKIPQIQLLQEYEEEVESTSRQTDTLSIYQRTYIQPYQ